MSNNDRKRDKPETNTNVAQSKLHWIRFIKNIMTPISYQKKNNIHTEKRRGKEKRNKWYDIG